ncbi:transmembrane protein 64 [Anthonomus grandis grandis]|uniref:transmembrane protein 64 n=1 Tax=Anthonomus grandis grandis TaxID=2921223 RepID=UPI002165CC86|nr:transmembrane protein 64 [Anthonomus grandis grandis]XP_050299550.1 transmembrane protein 64 [Anthonomus grandis grandis]
MKIPINVSDPKKGMSYFLSVGRILAILSTLIVAGAILFLCKAYIKFLLFWLEKQDGIIISATICVLFIVVALPISVGYIVLVLASGYLFGITKGLLLVLFGANVGLLIAHNILKVVGHHPSIFKFTQNDMASAIMQVISGPLCFKIVFCSRLTPIPFGLQNTIFALSNVSAKVYHIASLLGLFPAQFVAVYVGSTLRSMQDVIENNHISSTTYVFAALQLICGASLIIWIGSKARTELLKVLAEAENSASKNAVYNMV